MEAMGSSSGTDGATEAMGSSSRTDGATEMATGTRALIRIIQTVNVQRTFSVTERRVTVGRRPRPTFDDK